MTPPALTRIATHAIWGSIAGAVALSLSFLLWWVAGCSSPTRLDVPPGSNQKDSESEIPHRTSSRTSDTANAPPTNASDKAVEDGTSQTAHRASVKVVVPVHAGSLRVFKGNPPFDKLAPWRPSRRLVANATESFALDECLAYYAPSNNTEGSLRSIANSDIASNVDCIWMNGCNLSKVSCSLLSKFKRLKWFCAASALNTHLLPPWLETLDALEALCFDDSDIDDKTLKSLTVLPNLRWLSLRDTDVSEIGLAFLTRMKSLRHLFLDGIQVTSGTLFNLANCVLLESLSVQRVPLGANGAKLLARLTGLRELWLTQSGASDEDVELLGGLTSLHVLGLAYNNITDASTAIVSSLPHLSQLSLAGTQVTDAGADRLTKCASIRTLDLSKTLITDVGLRYLTRIDTLKLLLVADCALTGSAIAEFRSALPKCDVAR